MASQCRSGWDWKSASISADDYGGVEDLRTDGLSWRRRGSSCYKLSAVAAAQVARSQSGFGHFDGGGKSLIIKAWRGSSDG